MDPVEASKAVKLSKLPPVLVVHMQRFAYDATGAALESTPFRSARLQSAYSAAGAGGAHAALCARPHRCGGRGRAHCISAVSAMASCHTASSHRLLCWYQRCTYSSPATQPHAGFKAPYLHRPASSHCPMLAGWARYFS